MHTITCHGEELALLPQRALFWPRTATLLIADTHFGKDATFRTAGIPLPIGGLHQDLARLETVLAVTGAERLVILGDFFHARPGRTTDTMDAVTAWRGRHNALDVLLVRGNHDRYAGPSPDEWRIHDAGESLLLPPFLCCHAPAEPGMPDESYRLAGHLHPMISLRQRAAAQLRFPCFLFGRQQALLPAFASFTGGYTITPGVGDRIFAISPAGVHQVA
ncbi:MAG: ligase-associated DNA damage response endonuclease PdeM [Chloroflexi bacterium]|nr:MAG: ligase-associated DNA damage response endonuclease PdeM [Chloroflexota bacterium]